MEEKAAKADAAAETPAAAKADTTAKPSATAYPLKALNIRSAPLGSWDVAIFHGHIETWTYVPT